MRGEASVDDQAAEQVPDARERRPDRLQQARDPRLILRRRRFLQSGEHRHPLDAVTGAADDRHRARDQQRSGLRHAEIGEPDGGRGDQDQREPRAVLEHDEEQAPEHDAGAPGRQEDAEPGAGGPERLLRVDDLDRDDEREADQRQRLADQQRPDEPVRAREREPGAEASVPRAIVGVLEPRELLRRDQPHRDHQERGGVDEQRDGDPERRDEEARERGAEHRGRREAEVHQRVALCDQAVRLQRRGDAAAREPASGDRQRPVDHAQQEHQREEEPALDREECECGEDERLEHVDGRQRPAQRDLVEAGREPGREQRGEELRDQEEPRRGCDRVRAFEHKDG